MVPEQAALPDAAAIRADLEYMTARWSELDAPAVFEIRAFKENASSKVAKFAPDWIDEAVDWIESLNELGYNIYAVRNPIRCEMTGSAKDSDIIGAFFLWADCDDPAAAGNVHRFDGPKWSAAVVTGTVPTTRVHTYWALQQPITDMAEWRAMQEQIAAHFGSDRTVVNPSRIMRVGGTVAYPASHKQARGYVKEVTTIRTKYDEDRPAVTLDQMRRVFGSSTPAKPAHPSSNFNIDTGIRPALDRERTAIQALSGVEWNNAVLKLVGSYIRKGLSDGEIHALTDPLTLAGFTVEQTRAEVQDIINRTRANPRFELAQDYAQSNFDAPATTTPSSDYTGLLEWFDDIQPALTDSYIVKGVMSAEAMSVVYGPSNSGKTFFALDIAYHIAIGAPWRGRRVKQSCVLYLAAEGGRGVANRVAALRLEHGVCNVPFALRRAGLDLLHNQANLDQIYSLANEVKAHQPDMPLVIVIDTLSRVMAGGDENSAADMTALIRNIDAIREATGAHVMLVHHTGKDTARGARGHSSLRAATDTEIEVGVSGDEGDETRAAMVTKQRDYQGGETFAFSLKSLPLGMDQDGDEVTSCIVEAQESEAFLASKAAKKGIGGNQKLILDSFDLLIADGLGRPNPGGTGFPEPGKFQCINIDDLRRVAQGKMNGSDAGRLFRQAFTALSGNRGVICMADKLVWRTDRKIK